MKSLPIYLFLGALLASAALDPGAVPAPQVVVPRQPAPAAQAPNATGPREIELSGTDRWKDTGVTVEAGDRVTISASGTVRFPDSQSTGPEGLPRGWRDLIRILPVNQVGRGALIARIGETEAAQPFLVGANKQFVAPAAGRLFLGINQGSSEAAEGSFRVRIEIEKARSGAATPPRGRAIEVEKIAGADASLFEKIPRRVTDQNGTPGDMINFLLLGSEDRVRRALESAGWVKVDRTTKDAVLRGVFSSISKKAYVEMPMSELFLFGRPQDYGFAQADPLVVVAQRHHFRIWKAPFTVNGETVWVGAGTHDVGFDRDRRNNKITHRIDPNVDGEREFIRQTLARSGHLEEFTYLTPRDPLRKATTAHGQEFYSDGRVLILRLVPGLLDRSREFASLFCATLRRQPDSAQWGPCSQYLENAGDTRGSALGPIPSNYRLLVVPGVMNSCVESTPAFQEAHSYLLEKYGIRAEVLAVPNESSESNARLIADYLREQAASDPRKYIVIGYSKGAPDLQTMLALIPEAAERVAAFVSLAGAVGGSPIAEMMPAQAERWMNSMKFGTCRGSLAEAFKSLRRDVRQEFLKEHPALPVPTYSLVAVSDRANTSRMLLQTWQLMNSYDSRHDAQLTVADATLPEGVFLGTALADHFAVALPLANSPDSSIRSMVDKNRYPRTALLEAILRFVTRDLESSPARPD